MKEFNFTIILFIFLICILGKKTIENFSNYKATCKRLPELLTQKKIELDDVNQNDETSHGQLELFNSKITSIQTTLTDSKAKLDKYNDVFNSDFNKVTFITKKKKIDFKKMSKIKVAKHIVELIEKM